MKNYCPDLFNSLFVQKINENQIELGHCCATYPLSPATNTIDFNNDFIQQGRQHFLTTGELPASCSYCTRAEAEGAVSKRSYKLEWHKKNQTWPTETVFQRLDYNCDNVCNLKCIMCSGYYSSAWREDEVKLGIRVDQKTKPTKHNPVVLDLDLTNINSVYFNGGEPLMTRDHINVLNRIIEAGRAGETNVSYSSNGTFPLTDEMQSIWSQFSSVTMYFSIDAVGSVYEYVRYPGIWSEVDCNLREFKQVPNLRATVLTTIGLHNVLYFDELDTWARTNEYEIYVQDTNGRSQLTMRNFPAKFKDHLVNYLNQLPESVAKQNLLSMSNHIVGFDNRWVSYLNQIDHARDTSWRTVLDRLYMLDDVYFDSMQHHYHIPLQ
jgi:sulfatase maturation enzyme AslB (radical SAM superfamily)